MSFHRLALAAGRFPIPAIAAFLVALVAGCLSSPAARNAERPAVLAPLPEEVRDKVLHGVVEEGFTADMVYIALGKPTTVAAAEEEGKHVEAWSYANYVPTAYRPPMSSAQDGKTPKGPAAFPQSRNLSQWGNSGLPSGLSARGDTIDQARGSAGAGGMMVEATALTLKLLLCDGKVIAIRYLQ